MGRSGEHIGVEFTKDQFAKLVEKYPQFKNYGDDYRYRDVVNLKIRDFDLEQLQTISNIFKDSGDKGQAMVVSGYCNIITNSEIPIGNLKRAEVAIVNWIRKGCIRGWIFDSKTGLPELVTDVKYVPATEDSPACVVIHTNYSEYDNESGSSYTVHNGDCKQSVTELMFALGFTHETQELHEEHRILVLQWLEWKDQLGLQLVDLDGTRIVNDTQTSSSDDSDRRSYGSRSKRTKARVENHILVTPEDDAEAREKVTLMPVHPHLRCFDLKRHEFGWYYTKNLKEYEYNPSLRSSLVLPEAHSDLIDALTSDLDIIIEDVIAGKSGGTTILCQGKPGTGKTLTAEIYAEVIERPLYRIHSGQLGTEPEGLEKILVQALKRAERWKAILLIDEADVFLMERTDDLERNAVVGVFLRVLEYYKGILFLTTNRADAIDDAIVSRCVAMIKYTAPGALERRRIWATQLTLASVNFEEDLMDDLVDSFPEATGRDIKGLTRLTVRFCKSRGTTPTLDDFKRMATFKGL